MNRAFLKDSELFIRKKGEELLRENFDAKKYKIQIRDSLGTQTLESIDAFQYSQFPNDTQLLILLEYQDYSTKVDFTFELRLDVNPSFHLSRSSSPVILHDNMYWASGRNSIIFSILIKTGTICGNLPTL